MTSRRVSGRNPRATRACARCRKRKIKCDFVYPTCGTCAAVGVNCLGFDSVKGEEQPRSLVTFLENKVARLEIELASLQGRAAGQSGGEQDVPIPAAFAQPRTQLLRSMTLRNGPDRAYDRGYENAAAASCRLVPYISPSNLPTLRSSARNPVVYDVPTLKNRAVAQRRDIASIPRNVVDIMLRHYSEFYLAQYPIVDELELMEQCDRVYDRTATQFDSYVVCMALSISAHTLIRHDQERATKAADEFWETAIVNLDSILEQSPLVQLQAIMLLCHYSFVNPSVVNSGVCSRAAMTLCVQLGLHQESESPTAGLRRIISLESQRRIFWTCYVLDAQINMLAGKPSSVANVNITVRFPTIKSIHAENDDKTGIASYLYAFRQLETEITLGLFHADSCEDARVSAPEWLDDVRARIESWREMLESRQFASRIEFRYLMYNFQIMRLNRLSPRIPNPTNAMRRECIVAGMFNASEYCRCSRQGSFFYWIYCCWYFFEIGIVLVEAVHTGLDLILRHQETFLDSTLAVDIGRLMRTIPVVLNKLIHRWPQVKELISELERFFNPALHRLDRYVAEKQIDLDSSDDELVGSQMLSIRKYLLGSREPDTGHEKSTSYHPFDQQGSAAQDSLPPTAKSPTAATSMTMEEVLHVLHPGRNNGDSMWSQTRDMESPAVIEPRPVVSSHSGHVEAQSFLYPSQQPSAPATELDEHRLYSGYDVDTNWLSPTGNSIFWHGNGLELDDIFTAFNEGNIY